MPDGIELKDAATLITIEPSPSETAIYLMAYDTGALDLRTVQLAAIFASMVEHVQDQIGNIFDSTLVYADGTPSMGRAGITGDVQIPAGSNASEILPNKVLDSMLADVPEATVKGRNSGMGTGDPGNLSMATLGTLLNLADKADLVSGKVPSSQLPASVDDVVEYANLAAFPSTGSSGILYVALDTNFVYRWSGSTYVSLGGAGSLVLGETSSTAYRGDRGKTAYDHSQLTSGNPHNVTKTDVGLSNVDNTSDATKNAAAVTLTNKSISGATNTISALAQSAVTNLVSDLAAKAADSAVVHNSGAETVGGNKTFTGVIIPSGEVQWDQTKTYNSTRSVPVTVNDAVEIGAFNLSNGAGSFLISIVVDDNSFSVAKNYLVPVQYGATANTWQRVVPLATTGPWASVDFELEINVNNAVTSYRIRRSSGAVVGTARISIFWFGTGTNTFIPSTTTASVTAATVVYAPTIPPAVDASVVHLAGTETITGPKTFTSDIIVPAEVYSSAWNGSNEAPTKNDVYDKIEAIIAAGGYSDEQAQDAVGTILTDSGTVDFTYNDASNTITASVIVAGLSGIAQSQVTNLTTDLAAKVTANATITAATKTKISYDAKGLVISGADATTADIADSTDKRYVTDAEKTKLSNLSGTNSGDQTATTVANTPAGNIAATNVQAAINELDTEKAALSGATFTGDIIVPAEVYGSGWNGSNEAPTKNDVYDKIETIIAAGGYSDEQAQDAVGTILTDSSTIDFTYNDASNTITAAVIEAALTLANLTGTLPNTRITGLGTLATQSGTFSGTSSGTNTGDETATTIRTKIGESRIWRGMYASLALAETAASGKQLLLTSLETISGSNLTTATDVDYVFEGDGGFTVATGITLTVSRMAQNPGDRQIFFGLGTTKVKRSQVNVAWWAGMTAGTLITTVMWDGIMGSMTLMGGGIVNLPTSRWTTGGGTILPNATTVKGTGCFVDASQGSVIELTTNSTHIFKVVGSRRNIYFEDFGMKLNSVSGGVGVLLSDANPNTTVNVGFRRVTAYGGTHAVKIVDGGSGWEILGVSTVDCSFLAQSVACISCDTVNSSLYLENCYLLPAWSDTADAVYLQHIGGLIAVDTKILGQNVGTGNIRYAAAAYNPSTGEWTSSTPTALPAAGNTATIILSNSGGVVPSAFTAGRLYFARKTGTSTFTLHNTAADARANTNIVTGGGTGSGATTIHTTFADTASKPRAGFYIAGSHGTITIKQTQDEGISYPIMVAGAYDYANPIIAEGNQFQGTVKLSSSCRFVSKGNRYPALGLQDDAGSDCIIESSGDGVYQPAGTGTPYYQIGVVEVLAAYAKPYVLLSGGSKVETGIPDGTYGDIAVSNSGQSINIAQIAVGTPVASGGNNRMLFQGTSGLLATSANVTYDGTRLKVLGSSEQFVAGVDASNYLSVQVASDGNVFFDSFSGAGNKGFKFGEKSQVRVGQSATIYAQQGGRIFQTVADTASAANGTLHDLVSHSLEAATFNWDGDTIVAEYAVLWGANGNNKRFAVDFAGTLVFDSGTVTTNFVMIFVRVKLVRVDAATIKYSVERREGATAYALGYGGIGSLSLASTAYNLKAQAATATSAGDVTLKLETVDYICAR
jgi:hypothetical protein